MTPSADYLNQCRELIDIVEDQQAAIEQAADWFGISSEGEKLLKRLARYERWEKLGLDRVKPSVYTIERDSTLRFRKASSVELLKSGMTSIRARPLPRPRFSTATRTSAAFRPFSCRLPLKPA